jgi:hypothetical protein
MYSCLFDFAKNEKYTAITLFYNYAKNLNVKVV